jgi:MFS family permease
MSALSFPSWQSILPDLVPRENLLNAIALNSAQFQSARLLGPLVAGALVLAGAGMGEIFYANAASFIFVIAALWAVKPRKTEHAHHVPDESAWSRLTAGVRYAARENHVVGVLIISTAVMTIFGMPYMMLVAPVADKGLGFTGPALARTVSWIMAVNGLGAVFGALIVAGLPASVCRERLMRWTLAAMALCIMGYAASRSLALTLVFSALAGAAVLTTNSLVNTSIQSSVPGHLRGRVMALFVTSFMGLMPVSAFVFGAVGRAIGPTLAIGLAAVVLLLWALLLFARPSWLGLDRPVQAAAEADGGA